MKYYPNMEKKSPRNKKKLNVFAVGDSNVGKTTFLTQYCLSSMQFSVGKAESSKKNIMKKIKKTSGCDIHVCSHTPNVQSLISDAQSDWASSYKTACFDEEHDVIFRDLAGEAKQRDFLNVFTSEKLDKLDAIIFFFDLTNLKTFENMYKWLTLLFANSSEQRKINSKIWSVPILLIGTKTDQIPAQYVRQIKQKLLRQLKKVFLCATGENLLLLNAVDQDELSQKVEMMMFNLFLSQLCIEKAKSMQIEGDSPCDSLQYQSLSFPCSSKSLKFQQQAEFIAIQEKPSGLYKSLDRYRLNSDHFKNKRVIEEDKSLVQIICEVNQVAEYQSALMKHLNLVTSKFFHIKQRISGLFHQQQKQDQVEEALEKQEKVILSLNDNQL